MLVVMQRHHSTGDIHTVLRELNQLMSKLEAKQDAQDKRVLLRRLRRHGQREWDSNPRYRF